MAGTDRPTGVIHITGHSVLKIGPTHTAIEFEPETRPGGVSWISGGPVDRPSGMPIDGDLAGGVGTLVNDVRAVDAPENNFTIGQVIPPAGLSPAQYWAVLTATAGQYCNCLDYDPLPGLMDGYNSNSFVAGIIRATGGTTTIPMSNFIGGEKPVPAEFFHGP